MKKVKALSFIIAAAMLSAGVCAEEAPEIAEVHTAAAMPSEGLQTASEEPSEIDIAVEEPISDEDYLPDEDHLPDEVILPEEPLPVLGDIKTYLAENGCPDYVSFIFNSGAAIHGYDPSSGEAYQPQMTYTWDVGLVNATAAQKAEIEALINDLYPIENIITFVECSYSYSEREAMLPDIRETVKQLYSDLTGLDVYLVPNTEQIGVTLAFPEGDSVDLDTVRAELYKLYGDIIFVDEFYTTTDEGDGFDYDGAIPEMGMGAATEIANEAAPEGGDVDSAPTAGEVAAITPAEQSSDNTLLWICIVAALAVALTAAVIVYRVKLIPVFATESGDVTAKKTGRKQAEEAVKNSEVIPDDSVLQAIKEKIDK